MSEKTLLQRLGTLVALDIAIEQLQTATALYNETVRRSQSQTERKEAIFNKNRCNEALKANEAARAAIMNDLKPIANGPDAEQFIKDAGEHNRDLFYYTVNQEFEDQERIIKYAKSLHRKKLKKVA